MGLPVRMDHSKLDVVGRIVLQRLANCLADSLPVFRVNEPGKILHAARKLTAFDAMNIVYQVRPFHPVVHNIPVPNPDLAGTERKLQTFFAACNRILRLPALAHVAKDKHHSQDALKFVSDRSCTVLNRDASSVLGNEHRVIGKADDHAFPHRFLNRIPDCLPGPLVPNHKHFGDRLSYGIRLTPAR